MTRTDWITVPAVIRAKPLQTGKFIGILLTVVLAMAGFFRVIDARAFLDGPMIGDGQFLALILLPVISLGLVILVFVETVVSGYRSLQSEQTLSEQISGRMGYLLLRGIEATLGVLGVVVMATAVPSLFAESTPAPAGVGIMLLLFVVGLGILCVSLIRSTVELFVYGPDV